MRARMVFTNRQRLALDYDRFSGGIFNPSLAIHAGAMLDLPAANRTIKPSVMPTRHLIFYRHRPYFFGWMSPSP